MCRAVGLRDPKFVPTKDEFEWLDAQLDRRLDFYSSYIIGDKRFDRQRTDDVLRSRRGPQVGFDEPVLSSFTRWYLTRLESQRAQLPVAR